MQCLCANVQDTFHSGVAQGDPSDRQTSWLWHSLFFLCSISFEALLKYKGHFSDRYLPLVWKPHCIVIAYSKSFPLWSFADDINLAGVEGCVTIQRDLERLGERGQKERH